MILHADDYLELHVGDARERLAELPSESVHCVVTSPPYWGLRDYGVAGQLGLEATPEEYVTNLVGVFREVRRVLRADGTLWLNMGDSYAGDRPHTYDGMAELAAKHRGGSRSLPRVIRPERGISGLKDKNLVGMPWRVALALQADGWYLRSDIIWAKPNPMPESVTDRPTRSHEYLFLLSKSARYFFDADAVREAQTGNTHARVAKIKMPDGWDTGPGGHGSFHRNGREKGATRVIGGPKLSKPGLGIKNNASFNAATTAVEVPGGRNLRSVWTIATEPYPGAHFATFPQKLVEPCVKAGTSERGVCPECGAPWERETQASYDAQGRTTNGPRSKERRHESPGRDVRMVKSVATTGWQPSCRHEAEPVPAVVLDPFAGSGTVGLVAERLGRRSVLVELNPDYAAQAMERIAQGRRDGTGAPADLPLEAPEGSLWTQG